MSKKTAHLMIKEVLRLCHVALVAKIDKKNRRINKKKNGSCSNGFHVRKI